MKPFDLGVLLAVPLVIAIGQILFKIVSVSVPEVRDVSGVLGILVEWRLWLALALYGTAVVVWVIAIRRIPISQAYLFMSLTYIYLPVIAWLTLGESMSLRQLGGVSLILLGLYLLTDAMKL